MHTYGRRDPNKAERLQGMTSWLAAKEGWVYSSIGADEFTSLGCGSLLLLA